MAEEAPVDGVCVVEEVGVEGDELVVGSDDEDDD